jgi:hypothetical protein
LEVGIVTVEVRFPAGAGYFSLHHIVQTGYGDHLASSYPMKTLSPVVKRSGLEADHSPPSNAEVKNGGVYLHSGIRLHGVMLN